MIATFILYTKRIIEAFGAAESTCHYLNLDAQNSVEFRPAGPALRGGCD